MRASFRDPSDFRERLFDLLEIVFPGIRATAAQAGALGAQWESVSTPFVHVEHGRVVSHVGVIELPLVVVGRLQRVGSVHAVATHPEHRRRGHFRRLMEEMLGYCEARYETLILTTENPEYYEPFAFRVVQEHCFQVRGAGAGGRGPRTPSRWRLLERDASDVRLLRRLLKTRAPVSQVLGVVNESAVFCFNEGRRPLWYAQDLDVVVCLQQENRVLTLLDVVGPIIPPLGAILECLPQPVDETQVCFAPDQLGVTATPYVFDHDGASYLMVRGPFAAEERQFTLPRSART